ncbi:MAG: hypothetical protein QM754_04460 [Tepidisphaeraceae bacterium]
MIRSVPSDGLLLRGGFAGSGLGGRGGFARGGLATRSLARSGLAARSGSGVAFFLLDLAADNQLAVADFRQAGDFLGFVPLAGGGKAIQTLAAQSARCGDG